MKYLLQIRIWRNGCKIPFTESNIYKISFCLLIKQMCLILWSENSNEMSKFVARHSFKVKRFLWQSFNRFAILLFIWSFTSSENIHKCVGTHLVRKPIPIYVQYQELLDYIDLLELLLNLLKLWLDIICECIKDLHVLLLATWRQV